MIPLTKLEPLNKLKKPIPYLIALANRMRNKHL